jgi:hypothetical protein
MAKKLRASERRGLQKEAGVWDTLKDGDLARMFDDERQIRVRVRRPPPKSLTVALDSPTLNRLQRVARRKQIRPEQLAAMWIAERLTREHGADRRSRRVA